MKRIKHKTAKNTLRNISMYATKEEVSWIEVIREHYFRRTVSDTIRFLIKQEAEKILAESTPIGTK